MTILLALLLIVVLLACLALTISGMPGNWLIVAATAIYALLAPAKWSVAIGWKPIVVLLVLAGLGEVIELLAAAGGTARAGGSRPAAVLALAGSIIGAVLGISSGHTHFH